jgi:hypothetical protein
MSCQFCGSHQVVAGGACQSCREIVQRVETVMKGTKFTAEENRAFAAAVIKDSNSLEAAKLRWIEEYLAADPVKAAIMQRDLYAIGRLCGMDAPMVQ